ncbi:MAG: M48 family metalloprotease [Armatimonadetes bacterium]|nr:M48 family metalloprotease [Armatimonadota bacterium]
MKYQEYEHLVGEYRKQAEKDRAKFESDIRSFIKLGYICLAALGFLGLALLSTAILMVVLGGPRMTRLAFYVGLGGGAVTYTLLRVVLCKMSEPEGVALPRDASTAKFWDAVEDVARKLQVRDLKEIRILAEPNALMVYRRKYAFWGDPQPVLGLGLPLLLSMDEASMRAIVAHELTHLAREDATLGGRVHMLSIAWGEVANNRRVGFLQGKIIGWFYHFYVPRLNAMDLAYSYFQEVACDAGAVAIAGQEVTRKAICATVALAARTSKYVEAMLNTKNSSDALPERLKKWTQSSDSSEAFEELVFNICVPTTPFDTHPSLGDRLIQIGMGIDPLDHDFIDALAKDIVCLKDPSAWDAWIGPSGDALLTRCLRNLDDELKKHNAHPAQGKAYEAENAAQLAALQASAERADATPETRLRLASLVATISGLEKATPYFEALVSQSPNEREYGLHLALCLFDRNSRDARAAELAEQGLQDPKVDLGHPCFPHLARYYFLNREVDKGRDFFMQILGREIARQDAVLELVNSDVSHSEFIPYEGDTQIFSDAIRVLEGQSICREALVVIRRSKADAQIELKTLVLLFYQPFHPGPKYHREVSAVWMQVAEHTPNGWKSVAYIEKTREAKFYAKVARKLWSWSEDSSSKNEPKSLAK